MIARETTFLFGIITAAMMIIGCIQINPPQPEQDYQQDYALNRELQDRCGRMQSSGSKRILSSISNRLISVLQPSHQPRYPINVTLVACSEPLAFSLGAGSIMVSQGMIRLLPHESQLAFVIAHEIAHDVLSHAEQSIGVRDREQSQKFEKEADATAIKMMVAASYDPHAALATVQSLLKPSAKISPHDGYLSREARLALIEATIKSLSWQGPGLVNQRDYIRLRQEILQSDR